MTKAIYALPEWATVGARVLIEPGSYGRTRKFLEATVTRVTKTSVFAKTENGHERRFVDMGWGNEHDRLREYGNRGSSWSPDTYLWNPESESVKLALAAGLEAARQDKLRAAARAIAETRYALTEEQVAALETALAEFRAGK
jgi:hypothetical protein